MSLLAVAASRAAAVRPPRASAASGEAAAAADLPADRRPVKVILPKKKPQKWSTGMEPGEYGGGPTTVKPRKYWMGKEDRDPVGNTDDFIWNKNFLPHMERVIANGGTDTPPSIPRLTPVDEDTDSGFLSINRAMSLDSVDVDLSEELLAPTKSILKTQVEAARRGRSIGAEAVNGNGTTFVRWKLAPTRREQEKWDRATRATTGGNDVILRESQSKVQQGDPKISAAEAREQYLKLKERLQLLTLGIGGIGVVSAYVSYSPEIAVSFGAGLIGSVVYLRMLGTSVDSLAGGTKATAKAAAAQPRLLIPMVLVMMYNRWNAILVPDYGFMHLELIPMLVGFFTYKIAMFTQAIQESIPVVGNREV